MRLVGKRGASLGGTLLAVAVLSLLAFSLSSLSVTHLQLSSRQAQGLTAANAARSAVSNAISRIMQNPDFGKGRAEGDSVEIVTPEATGFLSFNESEAAAHDVLYSTNNLTSPDNASGADGALVPSFTVHLQAEGRCSGVVRRVEAVLRLPPFPWAIASGGRIETRNGVLVGAVPDGVWPPPTDPEDLLPADLLANGDSDQAVVLANDSTVLGDVETPGKVVLGASGVEVRGEVRSGSDPVKLPVLRPSDYAPDPEKVNFEITAPSTTTAIAGSAWGKGPLTFPQTLELTNAQLYVDGDLHLPKGLHGTGILVATGDITVGGNLDLEGMTEVAVISGGRVTLSGQGVQGSTIRGLFYAELGLQARELTLVGSLITGDASTGVSLDHVNVLYEEPPQFLTTSGGGISPGGLAVAVLSTRITGTGMQEMKFKIIARDEDPPPSRGPVVGGLNPEGLYVDFTPTDGGYPVEVQTSGLVDLASRTLKNQQDLDAFLTDLDQGLDEIKYHGYDFEGDGGGMEGYDHDGVDQLKAQLRAQIFVEMSKSSAGSVTPPTVSLFGDISRFLPLEDRVRVVSWIER